MCKLLFRQGRVSLHTRGSGPEAPRALTQHPWTAERQAWIDPRAVDPDLKEIQVVALVLSFCARTRTSQARLLVRRSR